MLGNKEMCKWSALEVFNWASRVVGKDAECLLSAQLNGALLAKLNASAICYFVQYSPIHSCLRAAMKCTTVAECPPSASSNGNCWPFFSSGASAFTRNQCEALPRESSQRECTRYRYHRISICSSCFVQRQKRQMPPFGMPNRWLHACLCAGSLMRLSQGSN